MSTEVIINPEWWWIPLGLFVAGAVMFWRGNSKQFDGIFEVIIGLALMLSSILSYIVGKIAS